MKIFVILTGLFFAGLGTKAQVEYDSCPNVYKYTGLWEYADKKDTIKIYLRAQKWCFTYEGKTSIDDRLMGWVYYSTKKGIVESTYQNRDIPSLFNCDWDSLDISKFNLYLFAPDCNDTSRFLKGDVWDGFTHKKSFYAFVTINPLETEMKWRLDYPEGYRGFQTDLEYDMFLPQEFVLKRQIINEK